jgi:hypothetical protein
MSKTVATRIKVAIAKTYGTSIAMSAITNAAEAVSTLAAGHAVVAGDILEITSPGWKGLDKRVVRVKAVAVNDVTLEGINTVSTSLFPVGEGAGSARRITAWDTLSQLKNITNSGGDQQFADATDIDDESEVKIPTITSARSMNLEVHDDPTLSWYATVSAASATKTVTAIRLTTVSGAKILNNAYWSFNEEPNVQKNEVLTVSIALNFVAKSARYAS